MVRGNPTLASPYFTPDFTQLVAEARGDVYVSVVEGESGVELVFPHHIRGNIAEPIGRRLSDFHGFIARSGAQLPRECDSAERLLRKWNISRFEFDHLVPGQMCLTKHVHSEGKSYWIDLREGFDSFYRQRAKAQGKKIERLERSKPRILSELGDIEFCFRDKDPSALEALFVWKAAQYATTGKANVFAHRWVRDLLARIHEHETEALRGSLSTLRIGGKLAAVHFGMQSGSILHYWFPAYSAEFARWAPGLLLLLELARHAQAEGVERIDLGMGEEPYKELFGNACDTVFEGVVELRPWRLAFSAAWRHTRDMVREVGRDRLDTPVKWYRKMRDWISMR